MKRKFVIAVLLSFFSWTSFMQAVADPNSNRSVTVLTEETKAIQAIQKTTEATVIVDTPLNISSGFFIAPNQILTTYHQFKKDEARASITVKVNRKKYPVKLLKTDPVNDIALLEMSENVGTPLSLAASLVVGQTVITVGNPMNEGISATKGMVSRLNRALSPVETAEGKKYPIFNVVNIATDTGNSGGALVSLHGEVVGMISQESTTRDAIAYTVRLQEIRQFLGVK